MKKHELLEAIKELGDNDEVLVAIVVPKDEEDEDGFEMGEESSDDSEDDDDDSETIDNGNGTQTDFHDIAEVEVIEDPEEKDENNNPVKFGTLIIDMTGDDEDDDDDEDAEDANEEA